MRSIPLETAIIVAQLSSGGRNAQVKVVSFSWPEFKEWDLSFGACEARWSQVPDQRLGFLYEVAWHLAHAFEIPTDTIHRALQAIPEYQASEGNDLRISAS